MLFFIILESSKHLCYIKIDSISGFFIVVLSILIFAMKQISSFSLERKKNDQVPCHFGYHVHLHLSQAHVLKEI